MHRDDIGVRGDLKTQSEWPVHTLASIDEFRVWLVDNDGKRFYRGQADFDWNLVPSIDRGVPPSCSYEERLKDEETLISTFSEDASRYLGTIEKRYIETIPEGSKIGCMMVMQHFGAPTRLLDWTWSRAVSAYFACISHSRTDAAIWWLDYDALVNSVHTRWDEWRFERRPAELGGEVILEPKIFRSNVAKFVCFLTNYFPFPRLEAQSGCFTIGSCLGEAHDDILRKQFASPDHCMGRIRIPHELKAGVTELLHTLGIHALSLHDVGADRVGFRMSQARKEAQDHIHRSSNGC